MFDQPIAQFLVRRIGLELQPKLLQRLRVRAVVAMQSSVIVRVDWTA